MTRFWLRSWSWGWRTRVGFFQISNLLIASVAGLAGKPEAKQHQLQLRHLGGHLRVALQARALQARAHPALRADLSIKVSFRYFDFDPMLSSPNNFHVLLCSFVCSMFKPEPARFFFVESHRHEEQFGSKAHDRVAFATTTLFEAINESSEKHGREQRDRKSQKKQSEEQSKQRKTKKITHEGRAYLKFSVSIV